MRRQNISRTIFEFFKEKQEECFVGVCDIMQRFNIHDEVEIFKSRFEFFPHSRVDVFRQESCGRVFPPVESVACSAEIARGSGPGVDHVEDIPLFANDLTGFEGSSL